MTQSMLKPVVCAVAILTGAFAMSRDLAGDWKWAADSERGSTEGTMHIVRADTTYTGTGTQPGQDGAMTEMTIKSARVRDDSVWMSVNAGFGVITVTGAFANDSTVKGTWSSAEMGGVFTMKRAH